MSKLNYFKRYLWLYDTIKQNPYIRYEEVESKFFNSKFMYDETSAAFSKRTFYRDKSDIKDLFGIEIKYDARRKGFYIEVDDITNNTSVLIDSFRLINIFQTFNNNKYISPELKNTGSEHLLIVLDSIEKRKTIEFEYQRHKGSREIKLRKLNPFFVKEYRGRWYVIGRDLTDLKTKVFALERIIGGIEQNYDSLHYEIPKTAAPEIFFKNNFGVYHLENEPVETLELSFSPLKGRFLKTRPLHHTQKVLIDNETEFRITVELQITQELIMEILSHGEEVRVIAPEGFKQEIIGRIEKMQENYS